MTFKIDRICSRPVGFSLGFPKSDRPQALVEKYGDALVCVRYRYDEENRTRIKTVELIVEKKELPAKQPRFADEAQVPVRVAHGETGLGKFARKLGGKWAADVKLWYMQYGKIKGTELEKHIVSDALPKSKAQ